MFHKTKIKMRENATNLRHTGCYDTSLTCNRYIYKLKNYKNIISIMKAENQMSLLLFILKEFKRTQIIHNFYYIFLLTNLYNSDILFYRY